MENKSTILTVILAIGLILVSLFLIYQTKTQDVNTINVAGSYSTKADPDQAEINFRVITRGTTALEAQQTNSNIADNLVKALKAAGLTDKDIETVSYNSNVRSVWENNSYVEKGFEVVNSMKITTKNLDQVGSLIDLASKNGVDTIDGLTFTLSETKKEQTYQDALAKAGENARQRAEALGKSVGFKVDGIKSISLESPMIPIYASQMVFDSMAKGAAETPIQPESVNLNVNVNVVFKIE